MNRYDGKDKEETGQEGPLSGPPREEGYTPGDEGILERLRESESKFRSLVEHSIAGVYLIQDGVFRYVNRCFADMLGYTLEEMIDRITPRDIVLPEDYEGFSAENIRKRLEGELESIRYEVRLVTKAGEVRYAEAYGSRTIYRGRPAVTGTIVDITDRRFAEQALRESEERYRAVFETTGTATVIIEGDTTISLCNSEFERLSGYERKDIEGKKKWTEFVAPEDMERMIEQHELRRTDPNRAMRKYEFRFITRRGEVRTVYSVVDMIRGAEKSVASLMDITDRKVMEEELVRTRNLESIGTLAGGIAHDFNNLLMAVTGYIALAGLYLSPEDESRPLLEEAERISLAGKELTDKLLTFSKGGAPLRTVVNLVGLVEESVSAGLRDFGIEYTCTHDPYLFEVTADEAQMRQVIRNLVQNAREAMPEGGVLKIGVANRTFPKGNPFALLPGDYVEISVEDEGVGIKTKDLPKIFDPYFSTKNLGAEKGMGLGLAVAYSVVKRHGGRIEVKSNPGKGTVVRVYLPARRVAGASGQEEEASRGAGGGTVLFMDDDDSVRSIGRRLISHLGYDVTEAKDGAQAVEAYRRALDGGSPFDVVVLDLTVKGGMGGKDAFDRLLVIDPLVRGIICSGYTDDPVISRFEDYGFAGAIRKPYEIGELKETLGRIMPGKAGNRNRE